MLLFFWISVAVIAAGFLLYPHEHELPVREAGRIAAEQRLRQHALEYSSDLHFVQRSGYYEYIRRKISARSGSGKDSAEARAVREHPGGFWFDRTRDQGTPYAGRTGDRRDNRGD